MLAYESNISKWDNILSGPDCWQEMAKYEMLAEYITEFGALNLNNNIALQMDYADNYGQPLGELTLYKHQ